MAHSLRRRRLLTATLAVGLVWSAFTAALPAQSSEPTVEELRERALTKLREAQSSVRNRVEFLLNNLARRDEEAEDARRRLVSCGNDLIADDRTVAEHLVTKLLDTQNAQVRFHLVWVLQQLAPVLQDRKSRVLPVLLEAALAADHRLPSVIEVLVAIRDPSAKERLAPLLDHARSTVRVAVIRLIGRIGTLQDGPRLAPMLRGADPDVALAAIQAVRDLRFQDAITDLLPLATASDGRIAEAAIDALAFFEAKDAIPTLLDALKATTDTTRGARLITALGNIGPAASVAEQTRVEKTLQVYLSSRDDGLVQAAGFALFRLGRGGADVERALTRKFRDEVTRDSRNMVARVEIARIFKRIAEHADLKPYYTKAIQTYLALLKDSKRTDEYHTSTYIELAGCYARLGQFKSAARYLEKIPRRFQHLRPELRDNPDFREMREDPQYRRCFE